MKATCNVVKRIDVETFPKKEKHKPTYKCEQDYFRSYLEFYKYLNQHFY